MPQPTVTVGAQDPATQGPLSGENYGEIQQEDGSVRRVYAPGGESRLGTYNEGGQKVEVMPYVDSMGTATAKGGYSDPNGRQPGQTDVGSSSGGYERVAAGDGGPLSGDDSIGGIFAQKRRLARDESRARSYLHNAAGDKAYSDINVDQRKVPVDIASTEATTEGTRVKTANEKVKGPLESAELASKVRVAQLTEKYQVQKAAAEARKETYIADNYPAHINAQVADLKVSAYLKRKQADNLMSATDQKDAQLRTAAFKTAVDKSTDTNGVVNEEQVYALMDGFENVNAGNKRVLDQPAVPKHMEGSIPFFKKEVKEKPAVYKWEAGPLTRSKKVASDSGYNVVQEY
jgi:hypothetical protein